MPALIAATAAFVLAGCSGSSLGGTDTTTGDGTIHIGLMWPQTGVYKTVGDDFAKGWDLYLKTHGGKLGGHEITVTVVDEGDGKQAAQTGVKKLIEQERVTAIVGTISSDAVQAVQPAATAAKIPFLGTGGRPDNLKDIAYTWHTSWQNRDAGLALADHIRTTVKGPVFVIGPDYKGGWDQVGGFVDPFVERGGKLANPGGKPTWTPFPATSNFLPYLNTIADTDAKAVFAFYGGANAIDFVKGYADAGLQTKLPLYVGGFTVEGAVLGAQGPAADGIFSSLNYAPNLDNPRNRQFASDFQQTYQTIPDLYNVTAYDAAAILDRAIAAAGPNPTAETINTAIGTLGAIDSPRGQWRFSTDGHTPVQTWYLRQVGEDGRGRSNNVIQPLTTQ